MKRLHPASAVFRAVSAGSAGMGIGLVASGLLFGAISGDVDFGNAVWIIPATVLGGLVGVAVGVLQYLRFEYDVRDETVSIAHGVIARTERDIPFGRIQNVDIRRTVVARLLGVATVNLETAGGGSTEAVLNVVSLEEAERIQDVVAGYETATSDASTESEAASESDAAPAAERTEPAAAETSGDGQAEGDTRAKAATSAEGRTGPTRETLFELSNGDLAVLSAVSFDASGLALLIFSIPFGQEFAFEILSRTVTALGGPAIPSLEGITGLSTFQLGFVLLVAAVQFAVAAWVASAVVTAVKFYGFRLTRVGEDLRYERGLLQRYTGTIPLEKVQTVTVRENLGMRRFGYAALDLETAGYGPGQGSGASNTAIPLDDHDVVLSLAERLGEVDYPEIERPPKRARRRYAVRLSLLPLGLTVALFAANATLYRFPRWWIPLLALPVAAAGGHYAWKHRGHAVTDRAFLARSSFWRRRTRIVPYYRIQTVIDERTVFQRWRTLASVTADTASTASLVGGDATAHDVDEATARDLHGTLRERLAEDLGTRKARRDRRGADDDSDLSGSAGS